MFASHKAFQAPNPETEQEINSLVSKLTIEEKIDMLGGDPKKGQTIGNARLGIPPFRMADGPAGAHWFTKLSTTYPAMIVAAASFDNNLIQKMGEAIGRDCIGRGIHILLAPGVNIYRSALCGRNFEYCGEDPYLSAQVGAAYIRGVQSMGVSAVVKHYAVNFQEFDRHHVSSDLDERPLREVYLPAFETAVKEAGVGCVMTAYNLINGVHASEQKELITDILKNEWGFDGIVMSDWTSVYDTVGAVNAGLDLEMPFAKFMSKEKILPAIKEGKINVATIDDKIRRMLRLGFAFGWMKSDQVDSSVPLADFETMKTSLEMARAGIVLLKNEKNALPLQKKSLKKIAVLGPSAHPAVIGGGGSSYNTPSHVVSILDALRHSVGPDVEVVDAIGVDPARAGKTFENSRFFTPDGDLGVNAEYFDNDSLAGEPVLVKKVPNVKLIWGDKAPEPEIKTSEFSIRLTAQIRPTESGPTNFYINFVNGGFRFYLDEKLVADKWSGIKDNSSDHQVIDLEKGRTYTVRLEYRKIANWIAFFVGFELKATIERERAAALKLLEGCDAAIVCAGFNNFNEGEGSDRPFALNSELEDFILAVAKECPQMFVVLTAGGNVDMSRWLDATKGLLLAWYPGQEGGTAVAEALFGVINPSGKLPVSFEKRLEDRGSFDCYHDDDADKRVFLKDGIYSGYRHFDKNKVKPLFPFGFGLSYTTFAYENIRLSSKKFDPKFGMEVTFDIVNTGKCDGAESAQIYLSDEECSIDRPVKELKGFVKVFLKPGERQTVSAKLDSRALAFWHPTKKGWVSEPGVFRVLVGASCEDIRLTAEFNQG